MKITNGKDGQSHFEKVEPNLFEENFLNKTSPSNYEFFYLYEPLIKYVVYKLEGLLKTIEGECEIKLIDECDDIDSFIQKINSIFLENKQIINSSFSLKSEGFQIFKSKIENVDIKNTTISYSKIQNASLNDCVINNSDVQNISSNKVEINNSKIINEEEMELNNSTIENAEDIENIKGSNFKINDCEEKILNVTSTSEGQGYSEIISSKIHNLSLNDCVINNSKIINEEEMELNNSTIENAENIENIKGSNFKIKDCEEKLLNITSISEGEEFTVINNSKVINKKEMSLHPLTFALRKDYMKTSLGEIYCLHPLTFALRKD